MIEHQPNNEEIIQNIVEFKQAARQWLNKLNDLNASSSTLECILSIQSMLDGACIGLLNVEPETVEALNKRIAFLEDYIRDRGWGTIENTLPAIGAATRTVSTRSLRG